MLERTRQRPRRLRFNFTSRVLALAMAFDAVASIGKGSVATAAPADIFDIGAPAIGAEAPKAANIMSGDVNVSAQTGALQYSFPIITPPGRGGMHPSLAVSYSSQAPIYGGLAAGWSLSVPMISEDTLNGRLPTEVTGTPKAYTSSLAGGRPLTVVDEARPSGTTSMRAQADATYTRVLNVIEHELAHDFGLPQHSDDPDNVLDPDPFRSVADT